MLKIIYQKLFPLISLKFGTLTKEAKWKKMLRKDGLN
jgi:hypothetical protein